MTFTERLRHLIERATEGPWTLTYCGPTELITDANDEPIAEIYTSPGDAELMHTLANNASALADLIEAAERVKKAADACKTNTGAASFDALHKEWKGAHDALYAALAALRKQT